MKLIISGPQKFPNQALFKKIMTEYTKFNKINTIVVGQESGVETMAAEWAMENKFKLKIVPTKNDTYKERNQRMAEVHGDAQAILHFKGSLVSEDLCQRLIKQKVPVDDVVLDKNYTH